MQKKTAIAPSEFSFLMSYLEELELGRGLGVHDDALNTGREGQSSGVRGGHKRAGGDKRPPLIDSSFRLKITGNYRAICSRS